VVLDDSSLIAIVEFQNLCIVPQGLCFRGTRDRHCRGFEGGVKALFQLGHSTLLMARNVLLKPVDE